MREKISAIFLPYLYFVTFTNKKAYEVIYISIPHQDGLDALSIKLEQREDKKISTEDLLEMA